MDTNYIQSILKYFAENTSELSIKEILKRTGMNINDPEFELKKTLLEKQLTLYEFIHSEKNNGQYRITTQGRQAYLHGDPIAYIQMLNSKPFEESELLRLSKQLAIIQKDDIPKSRKIAFWALVIAVIGIIIQIITAFF